MKSGEVFSCVIAVAFDGLAVLIKAPRPLTEVMFGSVIEDNPIHGCPEEPGLYHCRVKVEIDDSYIIDGVPLDEQGDIHLFIQECDQIVDIEEI